MKTFLAHVLRWILARILPTPRLRRMHSADRGVPVGRLLVFSYLQGGNVSFSDLERDIDKLFVETGTKANAYRILKTKSHENGETVLLIQPYYFDEKGMKEDEMSPVIHGY